MAAIMFVGEFKFKVYFGSMTAEEYFCKIYGSIWNLRGRDVVWNEKLFLINNKFDFLLGGTFGNFADAACAFSFH